MKSKFFQDYFSSKFLRTSFEVREINTDFVKENNFLYICCLKGVIVIFVFKHASDIFLYEKFWLYRNTWRFSAFVS